MRSLGLFTNDWTIKVRLTKLGQVRPYKRQSQQEESKLLPLEFIDEDGIQISATLFNLGVDKYKNILEEGKCYYVSNGTLKQANKKFTSIQNEYCVTLDEISRIRMAPDDEKIKYQKYNFSTIDKLSTIPIGTIVDTLGIVLSVSKVFQVMLKDGNMVNKKNITIYDETRETIELSLWKQHADIEILPKQIIAIKYAKLGEFKGRQLISLNDTTIDKNVEHPRVKALKKLYALYIF